MEFDAGHQARDHGNGTEMRTLTEDTAEHRSTELMATSRPFTSRVNVLEDGIQQIHNSRHLNANRLESTTSTLHSEYRKRVVSEAQGTKVEMKVLQDNHTL